MDLALAIEAIVPAAQYGGATNDNTQAAYDALVWTDARPKPDWAAILSADATNAAAIQAEADRVAAIKADAGRIDLLTRLKTATPAQIDNWLAANVTTLAQARTVLGIIIKLLATNITR